MKKSKTIRKPNKGRGKGSGFERLISRELDKWWGEPNKTFWRTTQSGGWGEPGDIAPRHRPNQDPIWFPFIVECKFYKEIDFSASLKRLEYNKILLWWKQLVREQEDYYREAEKTKGNRKVVKMTKLLIFKANNTPIYVGYEPMELTLLEERGIEEYIVLGIHDIQIKITRWDVFTEYITRKQLEVDYLEEQEKRE